MRVVVALGGNALLQRGESPRLENQRANVRRAAEAIAEIAREHTLVVTHGNGPQVGLLALQSEAAGDRAWPLDVLGAESEGLIGYLIEQELSNALPDTPVATLLTRVRVDPEDPAFADPTKPIGPVYEEDEARRLADERGWQIRRDGNGWRRVVASPEPQEILEIDTIRVLVEAGRIVVCAGGGGIPVLVDGAGAQRGIEAVVDKDLSTALLARGLEADLLLLLTDVDALYRDWPECREPVRWATPEQLRELELQAGTMGPKVRAACRFVERSGRRAAIGSLGDAAALARGEGGTQVVR